MDHWKPIIQTVFSTEKCCTRDDGTTYLSQSPSTKGCYSWSHVFKYASLPRVIIRRFPNVNKALIQWQVKVTRKIYERSAKLIPSYRWYQLVRALPRAIQIINNREVIRASTIAKMMGKGNAKSRRSWFLRAHGLHWQVNSSSNKWSIKWHKNPTKPPFYIQFRLGTRRPHVATQTHTSWRKQGPKSGPMTIVTKRG